MTESSPQQPDPPKTQSVYNYLLYSLSLPERTLRSTAGVAGGVIREGANLLVPQAFRSSKSYEILVQQGLDFLTNDVAGVRHADQEQPAPAVDNYVAKKAVGGFVEMASLATLHLSPALLLAVVSDVAYGSQTYLKELAAELKEHGVIDQDSTIDHAGDLLEAIRESSASSATVFDTPPLSVEGISEAIRQTTGSVSKIDPTKVLPAKEIDRLWREMHEVASDEHVSLLEVSGAMTLHALNRAGRATHGALSTVSIAGKLLDRHVIDHYRVALGDLHTHGYYQTLSDVSQPYIAAVWENFSSERTTITEDLFSGKLVGQATGAVSRWLGLVPPSTEPAATESSPMAEPAAAAEGAPPPTPTELDLPTMPPPESKLTLPDTPRPGSTPPPDADSHR